MEWRYHQIKKEKRILSEQPYGGFSQKELTWMIVCIFIATFVTLLPKISTDPLIILPRLCIITVIIFFSCIFKKRTAGIHALKIEHTIWKFSRYWFYESSHSKKPFPIGLIVPFFIAIFSLGYVQPLTFLQFESENISSIRLLRARGYKRALRKELINEADLANTSAAGFYALTLLALFGYILFKIDILFGFDLAKYAIMYNLWNMLPVSNLDGTKLFFGSMLQWVFLVVLNVIGLSILFL